MVTVVAATTTYSLGIAQGGETFQPVSISFPNFVGYPAWCFGKRKNGTPCMNLIGWYTKDYGAKTFRVQCRTCKTWNIV